MKRILLRLLVPAVLIVAVGIGATLFALRESNVAMRAVLKNREQAEGAALAEAARLAAHGPIPKSWDAAAFVPQSVIAEAQDLVRGARLRPGPFEGLPADLEIRVQKIEIVAQHGAAAVEMGLAIGSKSLDVEVNAIASGFVRYMGEEIGGPDDEEAALRFGIDLDSVELSARWSLLKLKTRKFASRLVAAKLAEQLGSRLSFHLPVPRSLGVDLALAEEEKTPIRGGSIGFKVHSNPVRLAHPVHFAGPLFTPEGVWLVAEAREGVTSRPGPSDAPATQAVDARRLVENTLSAAPNPGGKALVWLSGRLLEIAAEEVNGLSEADRRISIDTTAISGRLFEDKWQFLGSGEVYASLNSGGVNVDVGTVTAKWNGENGIEARVPLAARVRKAAVHVHLDPGPSGGAGTDVGIEGHAETTLSVTAKLQMREFAGHRVLAVAFGGPTVPVTLTAETDGHFVHAAGTARVAKVGARVSTSLDPASLPPVPLLTDVPRNLRAPGLKLDGKTAATVLPAHEFWAATAAPLTLETSAEGCIVTIQLSLQPVENPVDEAASQAIAKAARDSVTAKLVGKTDVEVLLAGLVFGKNNDIVRFIGNAISDLTKGPGPNNEFVKAANTLANDLTHGLGPNNDIVQWSRYPLDRTGRVLARGAEKVQGLLDKGGDMAEKISAEFEKSIQGVGKGFEHGVNEVADGAEKAAAATAKALSRAAKNTAREITGVIKNPSRIWKHW